MKTIHHSVRGFIPPHILEREAEHADEETRDIAKSTLDEMRIIIATRQKSVARRPRCKARARKAMGEEQSGQ